MTDQYSTDTSPTGPNWNPQQHAWPGQSSPGWGQGFTPPPAPPPPQPFYKKWWFVGLIVVFVGGGIGAAIDGDDGGDASALPSPTVVSTTAPTVDSTVDAAPPTTDSAPPPPPAPVESWTMPDLVGTNLQDAQNAMQALTANPLFFSTSSDLTGQGRAQVLDSNWQVCSQNVPAGTVFDASATVDFGVVRNEEVCP